MIATVRLLLIAAVLALASGASAQTARHGFHYGNDTKENQNRDKMDRRMALGGGIKPLINIVTCGNLANAGTSYLSPGTPGAVVGQFGLTDYAGALCDGEENATEATADEVIWGSALRILSMCCRVSSSGANGVALTGRSAAADLSPTLTFTIPTGATTGCAVATSFTTAPTVAAAATMAVKNVTTEDLSTADAMCVFTAEIQ